MFIDGNAGAGSKTLEMVSGGSCSCDVIVALFWMLETSMKYWLGLGKWGKSLEGSL